MGGLEGSAEVGIEQGTALAVVFTELDIGYMRKKLHTGKNPTCSSGLLLTKKLIEMLLQKVGVNEN